MARRVRRIEMLLDSYIQQKEKNPKLLEEARAHIRAIREEIKKKEGWDWSLINPRLPKTEQQERKNFGCVQQKRWSFPSFKGSVVPLEPDQVI